jgi:hypothetical protein
MTTEKLQERRTALQTEFERLRAHLEALSGAIQDCDYWLAELQKPEGPVADASPSV